MKGDPTMLKKAISLLLILTVCCAVLMTSGVAVSVDYADPACWAYYGDGENKDTDVFLICPTVDMNDNTTCLWRMKRQKHPF